MRILCLIFVILLLPVASPAAADFQFPDMRGWHVQGDVQNFTPQNLYEYIDGAADLYLSCGFEALAVAEYKDEKNGSVIVEVYRHETPNDAFGIYSQERPAESRPIAIGTQGYIDKDLLNFFSGHYYAKINSFNVGDEGPVLKAFAQNTAEKIGERGGLPALLSYFPTEGKKANSEKYIARNFLGYPFFSGVFTTDYEVAGSRFKLFLIEAKDRRDGGRILGHYLDFIKIPQKEFSEGRYTVTDPHHGIIDLCWSGRYIWGAVDIVDSDLRSKYLKQIEQRVKENL
jgi:hypothetical protein